MMVVILNNDCCDNVMQNSFYPLDPFAKGRRMDSGFTDRLQFSFTPDVLIIPSIVDACSTVTIGHTLCVNPGVTGGMHIILELRHPS